MTEADLNTATARNFLLIARNRAAIAGILLLLAAAVLYGWRYDSFQVGTYVDDAEYVVLAESIIAGSDYGHINQPDSVLPTQFPFGWPALLAFYSKLLGISEDFYALRALSFLFTLGNILIILLGWRYLGWPNKHFGLAAAALYAFSPLVVDHARMIMSEPAFLFFVLLGVVVTAYLGSEDSSHLLAAILLGGIWLFALYVRTIGITLVGSSALYLIVKGKWSNFAAATGSFLLALILITSFTAIDWQDTVNIGQYRHQLSHSAGSGPVSAANGRVPRLLNSADAYAGELIPRSVLPMVRGRLATRLFEGVGLAFMPAMISVVISLAIAAGFVISYRQAGLHPSTLYVPAYFAVLLIWPWALQRFLYGVLPFLFGYILLAGQTILGILQQERPEAGRRSVPLLVGPLIVLILVAANLAASVMIGDSLDHVRNFRTGSDWIEQNTPENSVIAAEQPRAIHLYTKRWTVDLNQDEERLRELACRHPLFIMVAPRLVWREDGQLELNAQSTGLVRLAREAGMETRLRYDNGAELVAVYEATVENCD